MLLVEKSIGFHDEPPADMVFSPGSVWPPRALSSHCCCGYFMLRSNENVIDFLESVDKRMTYEGDQLL